jgi:hypothetical protein
MYTVLVGRPYEEKALEAQTHKRRSSQRSGYGSSVWGRNPGFLWPAW